MNLRGYETGWLLWLALWFASMLGFWFLLPQAREAFSMLFAGQLRIHTRQCNLLEGLAIFSVAIGSLLQFVLPLYKLSKSGVHRMMKRIPKVIGACAALAGLVYVLVAGNALRRNSISASGSMVVVTQGTSVTFVPKAGGDAVFIVKGAAPPTNTAVQATNAAGQ